MRMFMEKIEIEPIGFVKTKVIGKEIKNRSNISEIILKEELTSALEGIEDFSHLFVLFWIHQISRKEKLPMKVHPRGRKENPLLGILATRSPYRPNPIGLTLVELIDINKNVLIVCGLDAFNGTPILDIKPADKWDSKFNNLRVPKWWKNIKNKKK
jgi:tRNA-Thr(GGU) m(6)t(6)A37 methyltransferase TsaA